MRSVKNSGIDPGSFTLPPVSMVDAPGRSLYITCMLQLHRALTDAERLDWLRLIRTENVGPVTFERLLDRYGTAGRALDALPDMARKGGRTAPLRIPSRAQVEREADALARLGGRFIAAGEPDYPAPLRAIDDAPPLIAILGHAHLLSRPTVAIVGARNASLAGRSLAGRLAAGLGAGGYSVASGLARGIDTAVHQQSLATGTIAVVAGGVDVIYPPENADLYRQIADCGVVVAESPLGTEPLARHFPRRNRIISGLARAVVVVEAALKSGSLITARQALEQGRDVMAVPGSPADPRAQGCNRLIKDGATLVEDAADILTALRPLATQLREPADDLFSARMTAPKAPPPDEVALAAGRTYIVRALSPVPVLIDEVIRDCQLSASVVLTILLELELAGRLQRHPGGRVSLD